MTYGTILARRRSGLFQEELDDEVVVYDHETHRVHRLNRTMSIVWGAVDGTRSVEQIAQVLASQTGISCDVEVAILALRQLERQGLLEAPVTGKQALPSRRELGKKFAAAGLTLPLLPVLASVVAPTPAMARSVDRSFEAYTQELKTAKSDIQRDWSHFENNQTAQNDFAAGVQNGVKGSEASLRGDVNAANHDYKSGEQDLDNMLEALGF